MYMYMSMSKSMMESHKFNRNINININTISPDTSTASLSHSHSHSHGHSPSHKLSHLVGHTLTWMLLCWSFVWCLCFDLVLVPVSAQCQQANIGVPGGTPSNQALVMWVSSTTHTGSLGGRLGANSLCTSMQPASFTAAGITSQAMLSYSDQNLIEALPATFDIRNTKGQCIAANREDLFNGGLRLAGLLFDQNGQSPGSNINVFTATTSEGYKAGLGFSHDGTTAQEFYKTTDDPDKYCNDFSSSTATTVSSLGKLQTSTDNFGDWIQLSILTDAKECANQHHIYCITSAPAPVHTVAQDPQFVGLQGQRFQVHGIPEEYFNLVSHPFFQLNSHFTYLATGTCNYNDTLCWSHPGTYVDELGLMLPGYEIGIFAGEHQHGLTITVNGQTIVGPTTNHANLPFNAQFPIHFDNDTINTHHTAWLEPRTSTSTSTSTGSSSSSDDISSVDVDACSSCWLLSSSISVSLLSHVHVIIDTPVATLDIYNADHFFNFGLEVRAPRLLLAGAPVDRVSPTPSRAHTHGHAHAVAGSRAASTSTSGVASAAISPATSPHPTFPMHGLVGQTWKNVKYPHGRLYAGEVDDYMLSDRRLFSTNFVYNEYQY